MKNALHRLLLTGIFCASVSSIQAQISMVPNAMNYQGLLTDSTGSPVAPAAPENLLLEFRIYPVALGGSALWGEAQTVTVFKGNFSVILGNGNALGDVANSTAAGLANVFANATTADLYFGITKDGVEFTPRQKLLSSAYALRAKVAESVNATAQADGVSSQFNWLSANNLTVNGHSKIKGNNVLEFGANEPSITKGPYAGQIGYKSNSDGLDIFGAGSAGDGNDRKITMHAQGGTRFLGPIAFPGMLGQFVQLYDANYGMGVQGYTLYSRSSDNFAWYKGGSHNDNTLNNGGGTTLASLNSSGFTLSSGKFTGDGSGLTSINPNSLPNNYNYLAINNRNVIEFGKGESKEGSAGRIGYGTFSDGLALDIVGAGTAYANRKINLWAEGGTALTGGLTVANGFNLSGGSFSVGGRTGQHLNLFNSEFGIGVQGNTEYFRTSGNTAAGFAWYKGGSHSDSPYNAGGGTLIAYMDGNEFHMNGKIWATGNMFVRGSTLGIGDSSSAGWTINVGSDFQIKRPDGALRATLEGYTGNGFIYNSDRRLKKDIVPLNKALSNVMKLKPSSYHFKTDKDDSQPSLGFIAQDVQEVLPELVHIVEKDKGTLGLSYDGFIPVTVAAVQEQQKQIETLNTENSELKKRLLEVEARIEKLMSFGAAAARKTVGE